MSIILTKASMAINTYSMLKKYILISTCILIAPFQIEAHTCKSIVIPENSITSSIQPVFKSPKMTKLIQNIAKAANSNLSIILLGETGVGKSLIAELIHNQSSRSNDPLVISNLTEFAESIFESELFGHVKGSFTGANSHHQGLISRAKGGTLFLDEIAELPLQLQVKLLRFIETGKYSPVGSEEVLTANVRIITATNINLFTLVKNGSFREDLYYRLSGMVYFIPPLKERVEEVHEIADIYLKLYMTASDKKNIRFSNEVLDFFKIYPFPGNIRELKTMIERGVAFTDSNELIEIQSVFPPDVFEIMISEKPTETTELQIGTLGIIFNDSNQFPPFESSFHLTEIERIIILTVLHRTPIDHRPRTANDINIAKINSRYEELHLNLAFAAEKLGITAGELSEKMYLYGLSEKDIIKARRNKPPWQKK